MSELLLLNLDRRDAVAIDRAARAGHQTAIVWLENLFEPYRALVLAVALVQCYASRTQTGCDPLSYHKTMAECRALAKDYNQLDNRALAVTGLPVIVHYRCIELK